MIRFLIPGLDYSCDSKIILSFLFDRKFSKFRLECDRSKLIQCPRVVMVWEHFQSNCEAISSAGNCLGLSESIISF